MAELYRKKPVGLIEVNRLTKENVTAVALWCGAQQVEERDPMTERTFVALNIPTLGGVRRASEGDYIVKTETGGFTTFQPREFEALYEKVE